MLPIPSRIIAACFALAGFAATSLAGAVGGNPATTVIWRATLVMGVCWVIGRAVGAITQQTIHEHLDGYKQSHPIPDDEPTGPAEEADASDAGTPQPAASS